MWRFSKNLSKDRPLDENRIHNVMLYCSVLWLHRQFWGSWNTIFAEQLLKNSKFLTNMSLVTAHDVTFFIPRIYTWHMWKSRELKHPMWTLYCIVSNSCQTTEEFCLLTLLQKKCTIFIIVKSGIRNREKQITHAHLHLFSLLLQVRLHWLL